MYVVGAKSTCKRAGWLFLGLLAGWWMGQHALENAESILAKGAALAAKNPKNLTVEISQAAERAGDKVLMAGRSKEEPAIIIRIEARTYFPALPGDTVELTGSFGKLEQDPESSFNYPLYLAKNATGAVFRANAGHIVQTGSLWNAARMLAIVRRTSLERFNALWPGDVGGLVAGILVGARGSFSQDLVATMQTTGLMHIVAVSGSNMTILINAVLAITVMLAMRWRVILATIILIAFTFFVGPSGAVVRACMMGIIAMVAKLYARPATAFLCLIYAAACMLTFSPLDLLYDIGFQLSFLAVLGLLWGDPPLVPWFAKWPGMIRDELRTTMAAILWTTPISLLYFGKISLVAPLANLLVPPSIPLLMLGGFITFIVSWIPFLGPLTWALARIVELWTSFLLWLCAQLASLPYASLIAPIETAWSGWMLAGCYGFLCWWAFRVWVLPKTEP